MRIRKQMRGGREEWTATCTESGCRHTETATDKGSAKSKMRTHDRNVHKPQRKKAKAQARAVSSARRQMRSYRGRQDRIKDDMSASEMRQTVAKAKADFLAAAEAAKDDPGPVNRAGGMHTKGIPNVKDGQKITGLVYDKDGKRVPWSVITKYMNVD